MSANVVALVSAVLVMVFLTFCIAVRMLLCRTKEMRSLRIAPQAVASSSQVTARFVDSRASDNFRNLFEVPVLFYALVAFALATNQVPTWLVVGAWLFVILRLVHSAIHCTYNKVTHRFAAYMSSFLLLIALWTAFVLTLAVRSAA
jgi:hypothetical protein